jgi:hypothetical protein
MSSSEPEAVFRVVRGAPTAEELAAIVGVLWARRAAAAGAGPGAQPSRWRRSAAPVFGRIPRPGPGAWRAAAP